MSELKSYTFLPRSGALYSGSINESTDSLGMDAEYLAAFDRKEVSKTFTATSDDVSQQYIASALKQTTKPYYVLSDVREDILSAQRAKLKIQKLQQRSMGRNQFNAAVTQVLQDAYEEYRAAIGDSNTSQLTIIEFVNQIVGRLENPSFITTAFKNIPLDKLRGKIPEMGWPGVNVQVQRLSEPDIDYTEFGQTEFRIFRNDVHVYIPREDRMEATIDPLAVSISQGNIQVQRARELLALKALSGLNLNGTYGTLPDITATLTNGTVPATQNDAPKAFVNVMVSHFNTYYNYLKYFIFNPLDYRAYLANWFTHAYTQIQIPEGFGVVPFFGLEKYGAVAIVSPYVPRTYCYALCAEGAFELDGPYIVDAEYDARKFADYNIVHDFIGYTIMNPSRFGEKLSLPQSGVTAGTEITTNKQITALLKAPSNLVVKNTNPI